MQSVNVALMKNGTLCEEEFPLPEELFDGDKKSVVSIPRRNCNSTDNSTELQVYLEELYYIHHVLLYGVEGRN